MADIYEKCKIRKYKKDSDYVECLSKCNCDNKIFKPVENKFVCHKKNAELMGGIIGIESEGLVYKIKRFLNIK